MAMKPYQTSMPLFDPRETTPERSPGLAKLNPTVAESDKPRLRKSLRRLLAFISDHEWHLNTELQRKDIGGSRFGGRLNELKKAGHPCQAEPVKDGVWRYRLLDRGTL